MSELIAHEQAARPAIFGGNCEFNFAFDQIVHESGRLSRWMAMGSKPLLVFLQGKSDCFYEYDGWRPNCDEVAGESSPTGNPMFCILGGICS
ncbi:MAG: hypothetical protein LCH39_04640 [Proteobacteria bacterium]|nr:hypothetical protein [Pseudomonadota bacterium]